MHLHSLVFWIIIHIYQVASVVMETIQEYMLLKLTLKTKFGIFND